MIDLSTIDWTQVFWITLCVSVAVYKLIEVFKEYTKYKNAGNREIILRDEVKLLISSIGREPNYWRVYDGFFIYNNTKSVLNIRMCGNCINDHRFSCDENTAITKEYRKFEEYKEQLDITKQWREVELIFADKELIERGTV